MKKKNAIVTCCTPSWLPYAAVTLFSCHQQGASDIAELFVVVLGATEIDISRFRNFLQQKGFQASLLNVSLPEAARDLESNYYGPSALLRLFLPDWISNEYQRLLYLDSDVVAMAPVGEIFEIDLQGKSLAAVEDWASLRLKKQQRLWGDHFSQLGMLPHSSYFNSGVMLFDWIRVFKERRLQNCIGISRDLKKRNAEIRLADQDLLNVEFEDDWKPMNLKFNLMEIYVDHFPVRPVFRHFNSSFKPWVPKWTPQTGKFNKVYRKILSGSDWPVPAKARFFHLTPWTIQCFVFRRFKFTIRRRIRSQIVL